MKKLVKLVLCGLLTIGALAGCAPKEDVEGNKNDVVENVDTSTVGGTIYQEFMKYTTENKEATALEVAEALAALEVLPFAGAAMEVEAGALAGFDNVEVTEFEKAAMFSPMIGTIPFLGYVFELSENADITAFMTKLEESANLRWNICTEAEELTVEANENLVFFLMSPKAFETEEASDEEMQEVAEDMQAAQ